MLRAKDATYRLGRSNPYHLTRKNFPNFIFDSNLVLYLPLWDLPNDLIISRDRYGHHAIDLAWSTYDTLATASSHSIWRNDSYIWVTSALAAGIVYRIDAAGTLTTSKDFSALSTNAPTIMRWSATYGKYFGQCNKGTDLEIWSMVPGAGGAADTWAKVATIEGRSQGETCVDGDDVYVGVNKGTGDNAEIHKSTDGENFSLLYTATGETAVYAMLLLSNGTILAGTLGNGQVHAKPAGGEFAKVFDFVTDVDADYNQCRWFVEWHGYAWVLLGNSKCAVYSSPLASNGDSWSVGKVFTGETDAGLLVVDEVYDCLWIAATSPNALVYHTFDGSRWMKDVVTAGTGGYGIARLGTKLYINFDNGVIKVGAPSTTWMSQGRSGDGSTSAIDIDNAAVLNPAGSHTIMCWLYLNTLNTRITPLGKWGANGDKAFSMTTVATDNKAMRHYLSEDGSTDVVGATTAVELATGTWYHLTFTFDAVTQLSTAYVNGVISGVAVDTNIGSINANGANGIRLLAHNTTANFNVDGKIGEAWVYSRSLTPVEVQRAYMATKWRY